MDAALTAAIRFWAAIDPEESTQISSVRPDLARRTGSRRSLWVSTRMRAASLLRRERCSGAAARIVAAKSIPFGRPVGRRLPVTGPRWDSSLPRVGLPRAFARLLVGVW